MTGWWGDDGTGTAEPAGPAEAADSVKLAGLAGVEPSGVHDPGGVAAMPAADAAALAGLTGLTPSLLHGAALAHGAGDDAEIQRRIAERQVERERERAWAREGLVAAGVLPSPAELHALAEVEHAKAWRDDPDPEPPSEFQRYGELPERYRSNGEEPVSVDANLARAWSLEGDRAHRAILAEARQRRVRVRAAGRQRMAVRSVPWDGPLPMYVCDDPLCECG